MMALSPSALLDLVEELKTTGATTMLQEPIDTDEASAVIGAAPHERPRP